MSAGVETHSVEYDMKHASPTSGQFLCWRRKRVLDQFTKLS